MIENNDCQFLNYYLKLNLFVNNITPDTAVVPNAKHSIYYQCSSNRDQPPEDEKTIKGYDQTLVSLHTTGTTGATFHL